MKLIEAAFCFWFGGIFGMLIGASMYADDERPILTSSVMAIDVGEIPPEKNPPNPRPLESSVPLTPLNPLPSIPQKYVRTIEDCDREIKQLRKRSDEQQIRIDALDIGFRAIRAILKNNDLAKVSQ